MKKVFFQILKLSFFLALGAFFIWLFLKNLTPEQRQEVWNTFVSANYWWVFLAIIIGVASHWMRTLRWIILLEPLGYYPSRKNTFFAVMIGYFANLAIPRLGEVTRCGILYRYEKIPVSKSLGTVVTERAFDMFIFGIIFFMNILFQYQLFKDYIQTSIIDPLNDKMNNTTVGGTLIIAFIVVILFFFLTIIFRKKLNKYSFFKKLFEIIRGFWAGIKSIKDIKHPWKFIWTTIVMWIFYFGMAYLCFFAINETFGLTPAAGLATLSFGTIGIIIVQGGIGIYPAIVAETLTVYGISQTGGYALGWLAWTAQTLMVVLAGVASLIILPLTNNKSNEQ